MASLKIRQCYGISENKQHYDEKKNTNKKKCFHSHCLIISNDYDLSILHVSTSAECPLFTKSEIPKKIKKKQ